MFFKQVFEPKLAQYAYVIGCQKTGEAVVIDPMRNVDQYYKIAAKEGLTITHAADTHIHADYISGLREFAERGVKVYASDEGGKDWSYEWLKGSNYNYELIKDGFEFMVGNIKIKAIHTPGHTPEHLIYSVTDMGGGAEEPMGIATGDFVFVGDVGRPDLLESAAGQANVMEPSARTLYKSLEKFNELPDYMQVWPGHGAGSACGKSLGAVPDSTVGYEKRFNGSLKHATSEDDFVKFILDGQPEPPLYFARMKRDNKIGPAVLGTLPTVSKVSVEDVANAVNEDNVVVLDSRERAAFMNAHLPGSYFVPFDKQYNTVAGSYVTENDTMYLVIDEANLAGAIEDLTNIGLDNIKGYITPAELDAYLQSSGKAASISHKSFENFATQLSDSNVTVVDVRKKSEFEISHIPGALNFAHTRIAENLDKLPKNETLHVHCQMGGRSAVAAAFLKAQGFDVVFIDGDYELYEKANLPVEA